MIQSIKVDIVYFMTATDFEFEFNLGGCCHMRLLNDKAQDKKSFVNSLARAVSRSQIIICVGPIFGEDGLISTTAASINRNLVAVDNKTYGISSDDQIKIINGAVPLVTPEGYFGGCIIESGKQTIVLLTENRTIRKSIMKNLIHPYIEDMSIMQSAGGNQSSGIENITRAAQADTMPAETEEPAEAEQTQDIEENEEIFETHALPDVDDSEPQNEDTQDLGFAEDEDLKESNTDITDEIESDNEFEFSDENQNLPVADDNGFIQEDEFYIENKSGKGISISILVITVILLLAVLALCYFLIYVPMKNGVSTIDYINQLFGSISSKTAV